MHKIPHCAYLMLTQQEKKKNYTCKFASGGIIRETKDTVHMFVEAGSRKWAWECWGSLDRAAHSATSLQGLPESTEWTRAEKPRGENELRTETGTQQWVTRYRCTEHKHGERRRSSPADNLAVLVVLFSADMLCWLSALCCLSCWISLRERERPVPS